MTREDQPRNRPAHRVAGEARRLDKADLLRQPATDERGSAPTTRKDPGKAGSEASAPASGGSPGSANTTRPKKRSSEKRKKSHVCSVRFTPEKYALLAEKARARGFTGSAEYLRTVALGPIEASRRDLKVLLGELGRSGSRLKDLAGQLKGEAGLSPDLQDQLAATLRTHECTIHETLIVLRSLP